MTLLVKRPAARCLATLLLLVLGAAVAAADDAPSSSKSAAGAAVSFGGAEIYSHICQGCHMPRGQGAVGAGHYPKLAGDPALASWEYVALTVLRGRNGMPSFGDPAGGEMAPFVAHLSDQQIADVVNYIRGHFGNTYKDRVTASQVAGLPHPGADAVR
jgi:mono/diheme cytochrome c family protein